MSRTTDAKRVSESEGNSQAPELIRDYAVESPLSLYVTARRRSTVYALNASSVWCRQVSSVHSLGEAHADWFSDRGPYRGGKS